MQDTIDPSPDWRPSPIVRSLRGRQLKRADGTTLTDLDAIATKGRTLIAINVKSYAPPGAIEGMHEPIRNI